eukprot:CAMPEP_0179426154 /NCGR_PEP_ID=MMETSP0799-20121207/12577_1 /TAXON_ID=46947 /ORGANISM="Geminigera cryophila, Strain CCMP2564" /LENGTH=450 /DNA_ID=CAMNT_0021200867 /DNA_START=50 /DNA_END=1402 /DNA_ORIENTATION=-
MAHGNSNTRGQVARCARGRALATIGLIVALCACTQVTNAKKVLGTKVRSQNKVYKVDPSTDLEMCKAIIREMHGELIKHSMREDGEDNIYDTAGMAICLGVVQNYTFEHASAKSPWKFMRKQQTDEEREDALYGSFAGANGDDSASIIEGLMLTKKACMDFAEELQLEISEVMYARVHQASADDIADDFCPTAVKPVKKEKQGKYVPAATPQERSKEDPSALMQDMLKTRDTSGAISEMLEMEASFPERMLDPPLQKELGVAVEQLVCQVCKVAVRHAHAKVKEVEKTPAFKDRWQRQSLVAEAVNLICHGKDHATLAAGYYPSVPGNPPEWANDYYLSKQDSQYRLSKSKPSVSAMRAVVEKTQPMSETGSEDEPATDWEQSRGKHEYDVVRKAVIRTACKQAIDQRLDTDEGDLSELLLENRKGDAKQAAKLYCTPLCHSNKAANDEL